MAKVVTRFAPSPTGALHLGHAHSAIFAYEEAIKAGGKFVLRMEDIDTIRCRPQFEQGIIDDLRWLGLAWEGDVRRQSEHFDDYKAALHRLDQMGLIYSCFCSRQDIAAEIKRSSHAPHGPGGYLYPGTCRHLTTSQRKSRMEAGAPHVWRLNMMRAVERAGRGLTWNDRELGEVAANPEAQGDLILARKDVPASYHLSVTVDDHVQGITLVTRGNDLVHATDIHRLLQELLGYNVPEYYHHKLVLNKEGKRFAKRDKAVTLVQLREKGYTSRDVRQMITGWKNMA